MNDFISNLNCGPANIEWIGDADTGHLRLLDQTRLPTEVVFLECRDVLSVWEAIQRLSVRGAPAIGIAAAYGCVIGAQNGDFKAAAEYLATSRPTAVNLFWAIDRMSRVTPQTPSALLEEARSIHREDASMCQRIGEHALALIQDLIPHTEPLTFLTHCNAGALATGGIGTATAPMYLAHLQGIPIRVFADETRPLLQGARLTAYELNAAGIDVTLICDDMAGYVMRQQRVDVVITGADRIASNGDTANKIGTYPLAVLARHHGIPFLAAAPSSTFDMSLEHGEAIPIEQRAGEEITQGFGTRTAPKEIKTFAPAFDITPADLITAIVTERGVIRPVDSEHVRHVLNRNTTV
ncbi:MAG: S-methyl-5-thioribose-1-phosphate isomerase [Phycisphaeraceae bacterium]